MVGNIFTCEGCGVVYEKGWSDAEAAAEYEEAFPQEAKDPNQRFVLVCDSCYNRLKEEAGLT